MAYANRKSVEARPAVVPRDAAGVAYHTAPSAPALKLFSCAPLRMTLSQAGCGRRWLDAQQATGQKAEEMAACRSCPIGAAHAGAEHVHYSRFFGAAICPRCRVGTMRMIRNRRCVNCYNRGREIEAGKNARGNVPTKLLARRPHAVRFRTIVDGRVTRHVEPDAVDLLEGMVQVLRTTRGQVAFAFEGPAAALRQGRLF